ncbi:MAG: hypothetical protein AAF467_13800 [Actinomycetota bacterium]
MEALREALHPQHGDGRAEVAPLSLVAVVADRVAAEFGHDAVSSLAPLLRGVDVDLGMGVERGPGAVAGSTGAGVAALPSPPSGVAGWADPWLVGRVHEQAVSTGERRSRGAWYTPQPVVEGLIRAATAQVHARPADAEHADARPAHADARPGQEPDAAPVPEPDAAPEFDAGPWRVLDPTCGGGAFLLAALDWMVGAGVAPREALGRVSGGDIDPGAVAVSRWSLALWALGHGIPLDHEIVETLVAAVRLGDALAVWPADPALPEASNRPTEPTLIIGNPPFGSPLRAGEMPAAEAAVRADFGDELGPYADLAAVHLMRAVAKARPGDRVMLVQPLSILAGRDTDGLRRHLDANVSLAGLWVARDAVFDAAVRTCAPILDVGGPSQWGDSSARPVALFEGAAVEGRGHAAVGPPDPEIHTWAPLAADALGAPTPPPLVGGGLRALVSATAGFRDEHYGLAEACREAGAGERLGAETMAVVTVGSIDPLRCAWGHTPFRFGGQHWDAPVVDVAALPPKVERWAERLRQPKVLLATQAKVLEPLVDRTGSIVPATPLLAVLAEPDQLDRVAAVMLAPPVCLWAWRRWFGTALSVEALKLAARQVTELPIPLDTDRWDAAAELVASVDGAGPGHPTVAAVVDQIAALMTDAYGAGPEVLDWWRARRP